MKNSVKCVVLIGVLLSAIGCSRTTNNYVAQRLEEAGAPIHETKTYANVSVDAKSKSVRRNTPAIGAAQIMARKQMCSDGTCLVELSIREMNQKYYVMGYTFLLDYIDGNGKFLGSTVEQRWFGGNATPTFKNGNQTITIYGIKLSGKSDTTEIKLMTLKFDKDPGELSILNSSRPKTTIIGGVSPSERDLPEFNPVTLIQE